MLRFRLAAVCFKKTWLPQAPELRILPKCTSPPHWLKYAIGETVTARRGGNQNWVLAILPSPPRGPTHHRCRAQKKEPQLLSKLRPPSRADWIRTSDLLTPSQTRYQAALRPATSKLCYFPSILSVS